MSKKKQGGSVSRTLPPQNMSLLRLNPIVSMIIHVSANLKEIFRLGRNYPWERPKKCPQCGGYKLWGHGYRDVIFDGFDAPLLLRRWRCPQCTCVLVSRPEDYCSRFQTPTTTIRSILSHRLQYGRWPPGTCHGRCWHWLQALKKRTIAWLGKAWLGNLLGAFDYLIRQGQVPMSRSI